ncbi:hypothetical protein CPB85DRAFT_1295760 [Mucidula mucida]|nr:hypothetical protein CPB85DRAFT_1295760 [Mucidula mucida]
MSNSRTNDTDLQLLYPPPTAKSPIPITMQRFPLPVELLQLIASYLSTDRKSLCALSLTCRALLPIARRHPFRIIGPYYLDSRGALTALRQALSTLPGLGATVRAFTAYSEPQDGTVCADLVSILNDLVNLQEVDLRWMSIPQVEMCEAFRARRVTARVLRDVGVFPVLVSLVLQNCNIGIADEEGECHGASSPGLAITSTPICLQQLEIDHDTDGTRLVDILLHDQCPVLKVMGAHEQGSVDAILRRATAVLRLNLESSYVHRRVYTVLVRDRLIS